LALRSTAAKERFIPGKLEQGEVTMDESGLIRVRSMMRMSRRDFGRGMTALAAVSAAGLAGRAASAASTVSMFGWQDYDAGLRVGDFLQKNDIAVNFTPIGNNDEIVSRLAAGGAGQIDIVTPYMGYIPFMVAADLLEPIDESLVPNLANVPEVFRNDSNVIVNGTRYSVPFTWGSGPMAYDPAAISKAPESWMDILKDEYKGKVGMMDDPIGNQMLAAILATDAKVPTLLTPDQLEQATQFLIKLKKDHVRTISASWGELADALGRGEVVITYSGGEFLKKFAGDKGKKVELTYPKEGTFAWLDSYCIAKGAPNKEAAHKCANQALDVEGQRAFGEKTFQAIVVPDAVAKLDPATKSLYPYDNLAEFQAKAKFFPMPPLEADGKHASYEDWTAAYQKFKSA
jgi:spermidine/putrescine transport system substrate-binding protein